MFNKFSRKPKQKPEETPTSTSLKKVKKSAIQTRSKDTKSQEKLKRSVSAGSNSITSRGNRKNSNIKNTSKDNKDSSASANKENIENVVSSSEDIRNKEDVNDNNRSSDGDGDEIMLEQQQQQEERQRSAGKDLHSGDLFSGGTKNDKQKTPEYQKDVKSNDESSDNNHDNGKDSDNENDNDKGNDNDDDDDDDDDDDYDDDNTKGNVNDNDNNDKKNNYSNSGSDSDSDSDSDGSLTMKSVLSWSHSESSLISAISLQIEKEHSKQEKLKVETLNKSLELLSAAIDYKIPKQLIPQIFNNSIKLTSEEMQKKLQQYKDQPVIEQHQPRQLSLHQRQRLLLSHDQHPQQIQVYPPPPSSTTAVSTPLSKPIKSHSSSISSTSTGLSSHQQSQHHQQALHSHSRSQLYSLQKPTTLVFKVNMPQQIHYQFHHWQGPHGGSTRDTNTADDDTPSKRQRRLSDVSFANTSASSVADTSTSSTITNLSTASNFGLSPRPLHHISPLPSLTSLSALPGQVGSSSASGTRSPLRKLLSHRRHLSENAASKYSMPSLQLMSNFNRLFIPSHFSTFNANASANPNAGSPTRQLNQPHQPLPPVQQYHQSPRRLHQNQPSQQHPKILEGSFQGNFVFPAQPTPPPTQTHHHQQQQQLQQQQRHQLLPPSSAATGPPRGPSPVPGPSPSPSLSTQSTSHGHSTGNNRHQRGQSKTDVNFVISPPDHHDDSGSKK